MQGHGTTDPLASIYSGLAIKRVMDAEAEFAAEVEALSEARHAHR
jgi:hypothetical protein